MKGRALRMNHCWSDCISHGFRATSKARGRASKVAAAGIAPQAELIKTPQQDLFGEKTSTASGGQVYGTQTCNLLV
jgi:hypothetical protein